MSSSNGKDSNGFGAALALVGRPPEECSIQCSITQSRFNPEGHIGPLAGSRRSLGIRDLDLDMDMDAELDMDMAMDVDKDMAMNEEEKVDVRKKSNNPTLKGGNKSTHMCIYNI